MSEVLTTIYVPFPAKAQAAAACSIVRECLLSVGGGFTQHIGYGTWRNAEGAVITETCTIYTCLHHETMLPSIKAALARYKIEAEQEAVLMHTHAVQSTYF